MSKVWRSNETGSRGFDMSGDAKGRKGKRFRVTMWVGGKMELRERWLGAWATIAEWKSVGWNLEGQALR